MSTSVSPRVRTGPVEFVGLMAMTMALVALAIDMMLPAFPQARAEFGLPADSNAVAAIVTTYFLGLAIGQIFYGPIGDRFGRKPATYAGMALYVVGGVAAALAPTLSALLIARFVWGFGAAGPRVMVMAIVRDRFEGEEMSRVMSFIMAVFILVPVVAPTLGAVVVAAAPWRTIFWVCVGLAVIVAVWFGRLVETLRPEHRLELNFSRVLDAGRVVVKNRLTLGYMLALTSLFGVFMSYLASSELIYTEVFGAGESFPYLFGGLAAVMGAAMLANGLLVRRIGTRRLVRSVSVVYVVCAAIFMVVVLAADGTPPLWVFLTGMVGILGSQSILMPNFNTLAMEPMGAVAGTASAVIGTVSHGGGALFGAVLDRLFDGTVIPLAGGFLVFGVIALFLTRWAEADTQRQH